MLAEVVVTTGLDVTVLLVWVVAGWALLFEFPLLFDPLDEGILVVTKEKKIFTFFQKYEMIWGLGPIQNFWAALKTERFFSSVLSFKGCWFMIFWEFLNFSWLHEFLLNYIPVSSSWSHWVASKTITTTNRITIIAAKTAANIFSPFETAISRQNVDKNQLFYAKNSMNHCKIWSNALNEVHFSIINT